VPARLTLGEFFTLWGQPLNEANVARLTRLPLVV
jgi:hypothetical protein